MALLQDAGQEQFGASQCETCGMVYTPTDAHDSAAHNKFHHKAVAALKFSVSNIEWKLHSLLSVNFFQRMINIHEKNSSRLTN